MKIGCARMLTRLRSAVAEIRWRSACVQNGMQISRATAPLLAQHTVIAMIRPPTHYSRSLLLTAAHQAHLIATFVAATGTDLVVLQSPQPETHPRVAFQISGSKCIFFSCSLIMVSSRQVHTSSPSTRTATAHSPVAYAGLVLSSSSLTFCLSVITTCRKVLQYNEVLPSLFFKDPLYHPTCTGTIVSLSCACATLFILRLERCGPWWSNSMGELWRLVRLVCREVLLDFALHGLQECSSTIVTADDGERIFVL